jgi:hypothetical protein
MARVYRRWEGVGLPIERGISCAGKALIVHSQVVRNRPENIPVNDSMSHTVWLKINLPRKGRR